MTTRPNDLAFLQAMMLRFRSKRCLHPRWTEGGLLTLLGAAADATAAMLKDGAAHHERAARAVDAANSLVLVWMHAFGWRLYLGSSQFGPEAGVGLFAMTYFDSVGSLPALPARDLPHELARLGRVAGTHGAESDAARTVVRCVATLAEVHRHTRDCEHPSGTEEERALLEHVARCPECRSRFMGNAGFSSIPGAAPAGPPEG
ncbi:MAG TPA: hypothetical protein VH988_06885 [Thermoanaerobaculia bacterium]|jgi:hypothetical protein|nr:hypothetical protein [Thermoanaerobaculia bacterium]